MAPTLGAGGKAPTLVVGGSEDALFPLPLAEETATAIPDGRAEVLVGAAHGAFEQRKRVFDGLVRTFLDG